MSSDLQARAAELRDQGCRTAYAIGCATITDPARATDLHPCLGPQWSGDLDSHSKERNADASAPIGPPLTVLTPHPRPSTERGARSVSSSVSCHHSVTNECSS